MNIIIGIFVAFLLIDKLFLMEYAFITSFIYFIQIIYMVVNIVILYSGIDFFTLLDIEAYYKNDYLTKEISIAIALILGLILSIVVVCLKWNKMIYLFFCNFIATTHLISIVGLFFGATGYMTENWPSFFIPILNIEYDGATAMFLMIILVIAYLLFKCQIERMDEIHNN